eukprot:6472052-Amphidinium_carterae.3
MRTREHRLQCATGIALMRRRYQRHVNVEGKISQLYAMNVEYFCSHVVISCSARNARSSAGPVRVKWTCGGAFDSRITRGSKKRTIAAGGACNLPSLMLRLHPSFHAQGEWFEDQHNIKHGRVAI